MSKLGSLLELLFYQHLQDAKLEDGCERELEFALPERKWRFDFAWPEQLVAVEVEGGTWGTELPDGTRVLGRHTRGKAFEADCDKYNEATLRGWRVFRFTTDQIEDGRAIAVLRRVFAREMGSRSMASG